LASAAQAFERKVHKHSSPEEYLKLAEVCLLEAERTLDREVVEMLLLKAGRYLEEAKRTMARVASPPDQHGDRNVRRDQNHHGKNSSG
jgi:hypothetical protein